MPIENEPPINENECQFPPFAAAAGNWQLAYCNGGVWCSLAAPTVASDLRFDPQLGIFWDPILAEGKRPEQPTTKGE